MKTLTDEIEFRYRGRLYVGRFGNTHSIGNFCNGFFIFFTVAFVVVLDVFTNTFDWHLIFYGKPD